eukprot:2326703-Prymnesium_polylepis.1
MVMDTVKAVAGADAADATLDAALLEAGVDSLAVTELSSRLRELTNVTLSPMLAFEHPTPRSIAAHVLD